MIVITRRSQYERFVCPTVYEEDRDYQTVATFDTDALFNLSSLSAVI